MTPERRPDTDTFRAFWPIVDQSIGWDELISGAREDLPDLAARARAHLTGPGRFRIARSVDVPGCGRVTPTVLIYEAPACAMKPRAYHQRGAA